MGVCQSKRFILNTTGEGDDSTGARIQDTEMVVSSESNETSCDPFMDLLPAELLGELFERILDDCRPPGTRTTQLTTLCLVAKGWNDFLETFSSVWTEIDLKYPPQSTQKHLRLSADRMLAVATSPYPTRTVTRSDLAGELRNLLLRNAGRIQRLSLSDCATDCPSIAALLRHSLPALEYLQCSAGPDLNSRLVRAFLIRHIQKLQTLNMDCQHDQSLNCEFPDDISQLPLKQLNIIGFWDATLPLLSKSPNLTSLSFMSFQPLFQRLDPFSTTIFLPELRKLRLHVLDTELRLVFNHLRMTQLEELRVVMAMDTQPAILSHLLRLTLLSDPATSPVSITLQRDPPEIKIRTESLLLIMEVQSINRICNLLDETAQEIFTERRITMHLEGERLYFIYRRFKQLSKWITEMDWCRLMEFDADCRILQRKERHRMLDGTLRVGWNFPRLQRLTLSPTYKTHWHYIAEDSQAPTDVTNVLDVLRARSMSPARALQHGDPAPPISIRFVERKRYSELSPTLMEDLRKVASEVIAG